MSTENTFSPVKVDTSEQLQTVTVIYYDEASLELHHDVKTFPVNQKSGHRVILPNEYRVGKSIVAICEGAVNILNKVGERVLPLDEDKVA